MNHPENIQHASRQLFTGIEKLITNAGQQAAVYLNVTVNRLYWSIGRYLITELKFEVYSGYGKQILATVSQTLSWSHFVELFAIEDQTKRLFYQHLCASEHWSIRTLRQKQEAMLPDKQWFTDKLHKSIALAQQQKDAQKENGGSQ